MIEHCAADLINGKYIQSKKDFLSKDFYSINKVMHHILDRLLKVEEAKV